MFERVAAVYGGANQIRVKAYNERLVLSLVRREGALAKADIARLSGLSAQAVTVLIRGLEAAHLIARGEPRRGKVGQPSIPLSLNPEGAFALGVKIGRHSVDVVLVDLVGNVREQHSWAYSWPDPETVLTYITESLRDMLLGLAPERRQRVVGIGVAMPSDLWKWPSELGVAGEQLAGWRTYNIAGRLEAATGVDTAIYNDSTAACGAELTAGQGAQYQDFVYFFVATFIGGGVVLNRTLYPGRTGNAASLGSMPFTHDDGSTTQLLHHASLFSLEQRVASDSESNEPFDPLKPADWAVHWTHVDPWLDTVAYYLTLAIGSACSLIDFEAVVIDGVFPPDVRTDLVKRVVSNLSERDFKGVSTPAVAAGSFGQYARAIGGASRPLNERFFLD